MAEQGTHLYLEPGNPHDLGRAELDELAAEIREENPDLDVEVFIGEEHGYGTTAGEVLRMYLEIGEIAGDTAAIMAPFYGAVRWAKRRWGKDRDEHPEGEPRPRYVTLYGPDGTALKSVRIDLPDGEAIEDDKEQSKFRLPWPPDRD